MRPRALGIALLLALGLGFLGPYLGATLDKKIVGDFLPPIVFGTLLLFVLVVNPLLRRLHRAAALTGGELAAICGLMLIAAHVQSFSLLPDTVVPLWKLSRANPSWSGSSPILVEEDVLDWQGLAEAVEQPDATKILPARLREHLAQAVREADPETDATRRLRILDLLNGFIRGPAPKLPADELGRLELPPYTRRVLVRQGEQTRAGRESLALNRDVLVAVLPRVLRPRLTGVAESAPAAMLIDPMENPDRALDGYALGLSNNESLIPFMQVPWRAWRQPLWFWPALILALSLGCIGLAAVLHVQWSEREHLPYPVVEFAHAILPPAGETRSPIFRHRLFWLGCVVVFAILANNYAARWWPQTLVTIPLSLELGPLAELFPSFERGGGERLLSISIQFTIIGMAFFLPTRVSFSLGVGPFLWMTMVGLFAGYGVDFPRRGFFSPVGQRIAVYGAFAGMFVMLFAVGRHYYMHVFTRSLGFRSRETLPAGAVWGGRLFLVGMGVFVGLLAGAGTGVAAALVYILGILILFVVLARLIAEGGVFAMHPSVVPCAFLAGWMGSSHLGADVLLVTALVSSVFGFVINTSLLPFAVTANKLVSVYRTNVLRFSLVGVAVLAISLAVVLPASIWIKYSRGGEDWGAGVLGKANAALRTEQYAEMSPVANPDAEPARPGLHVEREAIAPFAIAFGLVLLFAFLRLRTSWWPLHPILLVTMGSWHLRVLAGSFLIGCGIKAAVQKYGGARLYNRLLPLMVGIVGGNVLWQLVELAVGVLYYANTGVRPK